VYTPLYTTVHAHGPRSRRSDNSKKRAHVLIESMVGSMITKAFVSAKVFIRIGVKILRDHGPARC
jgi:hypothetical protein